MYLLVLVTPDQHLLTNLILLILIVYVTISETFTLTDYLEYGTNYHLLT